MPEPRLASRPRVALRQLDVALLRAPLGAVLDAHRRLLVGELEIRQLRGVQQRAAAAAEPPAAPLRELLRRPGVIAALIAAQASFAVMVAVMTLTGAVVVDHHHHHAANMIFPIIGAHVIGMFG